MPVYRTEHWAANLYIASCCFCSPLHPLVCIYLRRSARQPISFSNTLNSLPPCSDPSSPIKVCICFHRVTSFADCLTSSSPDWHKHTPTPLCWTIRSLLPLSLFFFLVHRLSWQRALSIYNNVLVSQSQHCLKGLACLGRVCKTRWPRFQRRRRVRFQKQTRLISLHMGATGGLRHGHKEELD